MSVRSIGRALTIVIALAATLMLSCRRDQKSLGASGAPLVMVLSNAHGAKSAEVRELETLLRRESGLAIELRVAPSSEAAVRMAGNPNTDAALLTLFEYLFCRQLHGVSAGLRIVRKGGATMHHGEVVVAKNSGIRTLADLGGRKFAFVDRYSSTGYVLPAKELEDAGVKVERVFAGSHEAALAELRSGRVAGAATYAGASATMPDLVAIASTPDIPNEPVFFRKDLDADKRQRVTQALMRVAESNDGKRILSALADIEGFRETSDRDYDQAQALISSIGRSVKDLVPSGWIVSNETERRPEDLAP